MAGHSKWANIKHRKGAQDARRGKLFTKLIREITAATRMSGSDPGSNPRLRTAIDKALTNNMTRDTVDRAIKRGAGGADTDHYEEERYEGYGPNGVAIMVDCLTDNRNRTVGEVRHAFTKHGGNLGTDGSVGYLFSTTGILSYPSGSDEDAVMAAALEAGAEDILSNEDGSLEVYTAAEALAEVKAAMAAAGVPPENAELTMKASIYVDLEFEDAETVVKLVERLEDLDDVQQVYTNADFSAEVMERLAE